MCGGCRLCVSGRNQRARDVHRLQRRVEPSGTVSSLAGLGYPFILVTVLQ